MANAEKQRIAGLKETIDRAREKEQQEMTSLRELSNRREWLLGELASALEKMSSSIIFLDPTEVAGLISRRDALTEMLGGGGLEEQTIRYRIGAATNAVCNAERALREEELPLREVRQREFAGR